MDDRKSSTVTAKDTGTAQKKSPSPAALENERQQLLAMLGCLDESQTRAPLEENWPPMAGNSNSVAASAKLKMEEIFDLDWQKRGKEAIEAVLTGVPPPPCPAPVPTPEAVNINKRTLHRQPSISAAYDEVEQLAATSANLSEKAAEEEEEGEDEKSPGFKKRRPKQFHPRKSSREELESGLESPVEVENSCSSSVIVKSASSSAVGIGKMPLGGVPNRDSGFFDFSAEDSSSTGGVGCTQGKSGSSESNKEEGQAHKSHHHATHPIPLDRKQGGTPGGVGMKDPRLGTREPRELVTDLPLPNFAAEIKLLPHGSNIVAKQEAPLAVGGTKRSTTDVSSSRESIEEPSRPTARRTVSGGSSSEDLGGLMTSPEGSLSTPTHGANNSNEIFGSGNNSMKSRIPFNTSGSVSPNRPSLEERIRALDAKFSALEQNVQAAKDKPSQSSRAVDISKYVVKRKQSTGGGNSTPTPAPDSTTSAADYTKSLYRSSIFDQDIERLKTIDEKYTPSPAALLTRTLEVKPDAMDILDLVDSKEPLYSSGLVKKQGTSDQKGIIHKLRDSFSQELVHM